MEENKTEVFATPIKDRLFPLFAVNNICCQHSSSTFIKDIQRSSQKLKSGINDLIMNNPQYFKLAQ